MDYYLKGGGTKVLEAKVSVSNGRITLHSRSGRARKDPAGSRGRNPDYVPAFDAIFDRLNVQSAAIDRVLLDSSLARLVPETERVLANRSDFESETLHLVKNQIRRKMRKFGRSPELPANEGNQNKKILVETDLSDAEVIRRLRTVPLAQPSASSAGNVAQSLPSPRVIPLPASEQRKVTPEHILTALLRLDGGDEAANFAPSQDYNVLTDDGRKYAPKKVFGLALEEALNIEARPGHFNAGWGTPCFNILESSGLWIVPKPGSAGRPKPSDAAIAKACQDIIPTDEERAWIEGNPRMGSHLKKERRPGLAKLKREQFTLDHGKLRCERCDLDPVVAYGEDAGAACIEVHHHRVHVADMDAGHETSLDDLKCLCANCHRVLHRALSLGLPFDLTIDSHDTTAEAETSAPREA